MGADTPWKIVEPFGGLAPYSLRAMWEMAGGRRRKLRSAPPYSRMGNKAGFVSNVLKVFGLSRVKWSSAWLNELDPLCHGLHWIYASAELRQLVARRIWAMIPCPGCMPGEIARALSGESRPTPESLGRLKAEQASQEGRYCSECLTVPQGGYPHSPGVQDARKLWTRLKAKPIPSELAEFLSEGIALQASRAPHAIAKRLESLPCGLATLADVLACGAFLQSRSFQLKPVVLSVGGFKMQGMKPEIDRYERKAKRSAFLDSPRWTIAGRFEALPGPGSMSLQITMMDAAKVLPEGSADNTLVVFDPPYPKTTGYQADCSFEASLLNAQAWARAGALVVFHEARPLAGMLGQGWESRPASCLRGKKSTFWAGEEREFITFNRPVVWWPEAQGEMFG